MVQFHNPVVHHLVQCQVLVRIWIPTLLIFMLKSLYCQAALHLPQSCTEKSVFCTGPGHLNVAFLADRRTELCTTVRTLH